MPFRTLGLTLLLLSTLSYAQGRKPAVEDFVGIEVDHPESIPQGSESLYNLEKDINQIGTLKSEAPKKTSDRASAQNGDMPINWSTIIALTIILGLPLISWFLVMNHIRQKATLENASNIAVLENYRKERELAKKAESTIKKAS